MGGVAIASLQKLRDIKAIGQRGSVDLMSYLVSKVQSNEPGLVVQVRAETTNIGAARHCEMEVAKVGLEELQSGIHRLVQYETELTKNGDEESLELLERVSAFRVKSTTAVRDAVQNYEKAVVDLTNCRNYLGDRNTPPSELFARLDAFVQPFLVKALA